MNWTINALSVELQNKHAMVTLTVAPPTAPVSPTITVMFPFDPPGQQNETALRQLAITEAKRICADAAKANLA